MQRAEQIMSQHITKQEYDQFHDNDDDDELCRICDTLDNASKGVQSQQNELNNENLTQNTIGGVKRKRLGVSTTPNERRAIIRKH